MNSSDGEWGQVWYRGKPPKREECQCRTHVCNGDCHKPKKTKAIAKKKEPKAPRPPIDKKALAINLVEAIRNKDKNKKESYDKDFIDDTSVAYNPDDYEEDFEPKNNLHVPKRAKQPKPPGEPKPSAHEKNETGNEPQIFDFMRIFESVNINMTAPQFIVNVGKIMEKGYQMYPIGPIEGHPNSVFISRVSAPVNKVTPTGGYVEKNVFLVNKLPSSIPPCYMDEKQMGQWFGNNISFYWNMCAQWNDAFSKWVNNQRGQRSHNNNENFLKRSCRSYKNWFFCFMFWREYRVPILRISNVTPDEVIMNHLNRDIGNPFLLTRDQWHHMNQILSADKLLSECKGLIVQLCEAEETSRSVLDKFLNYENCKYEGWKDYAEAKSVSPNKWDEIIAKNASPDVPGLSTKLSTEVDKMLPGDAGQPVWAAEKIDLNWSAIELWLERTPEFMEWEMASSLELNT